MIFSRSARRPDSRIITPVSPAPKTIFRSEVELCVFAESHTRAGTHAEVSSSIAYRRYSWCDDNIFFERRYRIYAYV